MTDHVERDCGVEGACAEYLEAIRDTPTIDGVQAVLRKCYEPAVLAALDVETIAVIVDVEARTIGALRLQRLSAAIELRLDRGEQDVSTALALLSSAQLLYGTPLWQRLHKYCEVLAKTEAQRAELDAILSAGAHAV